MGELRGLFEVVDGTPPSPRPGWRARLIFDNAQTLADGEPAYPHRPVKGVRQSMVLRLPNGNLRVRSTE